MITKKKIRRYQRILIRLALILSLISACSPAPNIEEEIQNIPNPESTETLVVSTETEEIIDEPTPILDVSGWIVKIGELECSLEKFDNEYPRWFKAVCPEELWLPIGQITLVEVITEKSNCALRQAEDVEEVIGVNFPDALTIEFVQLENGIWGCQIPYSDQAGIEVVCGLKVDCERIGEELRMIIFGKTKRDYLKEENGGINGFDDGTGGGSGEEGPPPHQE